MREREREPHNFLTNLSYLYNQHLQWDVKIVLGLNGSEPKIRKPIEYTNSYISLTKRETFHKTFIRQNHTSCTDNISVGLSEKWSLKRSPRLPLLFSDISQPVFAASFCCCNVLQKLQWITCFYSIHHYMHVKLNMLCISSVWIKWGTAPSAFETVILFLYLIHNAIVTSNERYHDLV